MARGEAKVDEPHRRARPISKDQVVGLDIPVSYSERMHVTERTSHLACNLERLELGKPQAMTLRMQVLLEGAALAVLEDCMQLVLRLERCDQIRHVYVRRRLQPRQSVELSPNVFEGGRGLAAACACLKGLDRHLEKAPEAMGLSDW